MWRFVWRLAKDTFFSVLIAVALLSFALFGLLRNKSIRPLYEGRSYYQYKVDAIDIMDGLSYFILQPVEKPRRWVPRFVRNLPLVGRPISGAAEVICFAPCFWTIVSYLTIVGGRRFRRWVDQQEQRDSKPRRPPVVNRPAG